jgi:lipopolysaccharide export system permease protein
MRARTVTLSSAGVQSSVRASRRGRRIRLSFTLSTYLAYQVLLGIGIATFGLAMVALVADLVELLRRAHGRAGASFGVVTLMAGLHLPFLVQKLMPFVILFGTMLTFQRLTRSHELVAARASGVSVWQFLAPALLLALGIGVFIVVAFNPLASILVARYDALDRVYLSGDESLITVAPGGLWLRQRRGDEELLIHARQVDDASSVLEEVVVLIYDEQYRFTGRLDAPTARLQAGFWELATPLRTRPDGSSEKVPSLTIATDLTTDRIQENFAPPESLSFWDLPTFIEDLEAIGFSAREHRLYWHSLLALPFLLCAMLLIGTTSSLRLVRHGGTGLLVVGGLVGGFAVYALTDVTFAVGLSGRLPVVLAAWAPAGISILLGLTTLLHLEDG